MADISKRIAEVIQEKSLSQKDFAASLNFTPGYINDILRGRTTPSIRVVERMTRVFNVSADWLLPGKGPKYGERRVRYQLDKIEVVTLKELIEREGKFGRRKHDFVAVPILSLPMLPGSQTDITSLAVDEYCVVPHGWVKRPGSTFCCKVDGLRMEPTIPIGSIVAVDTSVKTPSRLDGKLCAINAQPTPIIRRLHVTKTYLTFNVDNNLGNYRPLRVKAGGENPIIGKVEWIHHLRE
ncbi:MAG: helix-turn-helix domain-containing protein [Planctomycetota bacterium]|jgi:transcriptional regulator with XRE-family HTH domain